MLYLFYNDVISVYPFLEGYKMFPEGKCSISSSGWLELLANGIPNVEKRLGKRQELFGRDKCQAKRLPHQHAGQLNDM